MQQVLQAGRGWWRQTWTALPNVSFLHFSPGASVCFLLLYYYFCPFHPGPHSLPLLHCEIHFELRLITFFFPCRIFIILSITLQETPRAEMDNSKGHFSCFLSLSSGYKRLLRVIFDPKFYFIGFLMSPSYNMHFEPIIDRFWHSLTYICCQRRSNTFLRTVIRLFFSRMYVLVANTMFSHFSLDLQKEKKNENKHDRRHQLCPFVCR